MKLFLKGCDHEYAIIEEPSVNQGINNYLQQYSSELLVMVAHKHTFFGTAIFQNPHHGNGLRNPYAPVNICRIKINGQYTPRLVLTEFSVCLTFATQFKKALWQQLPERISDC